MVLYKFDPEGKPKEKERAKTDAAGKFSFKDLEPGKYTLTAAKPASRTKASEQVEVEAGKVVTADLKLSRERGASAPVAMWGMVRPAPSSLGRRIIRIAAGIGGHP